MMRITETAKKNHDELFPGHVSILAEKDPEFIEVFDNFAFDEVLQYTSLDVKERQKVLLAALIAMQCVNEFKAMAKGALNVGITPIEVKEIVYQAVPYAGLGKVFDFLHAANEVLEERGITLPLEGQSTTTMETVLRRAWRLSVKLLGMQWTLCWTRCRRTRSISPLSWRTTVSVISLRAAEQQLKGHIRNNLRIGNDKQKLLDTITVLLPFIGYPRTLTALNCLNEVAPEES